MKYFRLLLTEGGNRGGNKLFLLAILCGMMAVLPGCGEKEMELLESVDTAMGTVIQQRIYVEEGQGEGLTEEVMALITELEEQELSWRIPEAEVAGINEQALLADAEIPLSTRMQEILTTCLQVSVDSSGAFDPTMGDVVQLWDIDSWAVQEETQAYVLPDQESIATALQGTGYERLVLDEAAGTLLLPQGMKLDLGAVGKGIALDRIRELLEERAEGAVISAGGSILTYGERPDGVPWRVGIMDPQDTSGLIGYLELEGSWCVSTSGDYERYVEVGGTRYHHIIDPATGYPAESGVRSVTILTQNGLLSDALSTACFVLGAEKGLRLAETYEVEALFVTTDGQIQMTTGMEPLFTLMKNS